MGLNRFFQPMMLLVAMLVVSSRTLAADELPTFQLLTKDGRFTPETIEVPAGTKFKLVVTNEGAGPEEFESRELNREKVIPAGKKADILIGPLKPGTYGFFGEFHPKTANGQIVAK
jgi:cupredoxin-like protein